MPPRVRIIGIDPGLSISGFAVIDSNSNTVKLVECGLIKTRTKDSTADRLNQIHTAVSKLIDKHKPSALAVEDNFYGKNFKTAKLMSQAEAMILLAGAETNLTIRKFPTKTVKQAVVGRGDASKSQVSFMVGRHLRLKTDSVPRDISDALAVALCCMFKSNSTRRGVSVFDSISGRVAG
ncbi:MAG: crossover junction endodeoxyribonuclease RuvC [candidate division Zixibacteria bacterium]|nr:crossover junction endodeoxyribonuclease RuvC [candidate division Zixibacteria bacterium]